ncbi:MAG: hypothetical protein AB8H86_32835 [Polyangiales bacterium]
MRTEVPFPTLDVTILENQAVLDAVRPHAGRGALVDVRATPGRNDSAFEEALKQFRMEIPSIFARVAVLMKTATGVMHASRLSAGDETLAVTRIFDNEEAAVSYAIAKPRVATGW